MIRRMQFALAAAAVSLSAVGMPAAAQTVMKVGTETNGVPFSFLDPATHQMQGFMVDLIQAVGKHAGFTPAVEAMDFSALISSLTSQKIDIIASAMYITDKRRQVIDFTKPVYTYGEGMIVPATDKTDYDSYQAFKGRVVGAQVGTVYGESLKNTGLFKEVKIYDTIPDIIRDVNAGRIDAGIADYPTLSYYLGLGQFPRTRLVQSYKASLPGSIGLGLRQGEDALKQKLQAALDEIKRNGELDALLKKWKLV
ncbi:ABC transporter substrate-binding protein [Bordetella sp. BOR01]|uniref:ABC transporter substrate-binding protein n=1 Tax=Bordetella sp. BOR01 TaxID=2854779 RepID=UPI001C439FF4|nr:ABC transporter substrate-binding protein [Bordetella sp. BOR01]MBV7485397.1 ABC transporter substrate-binding protein [Bordetella sp. BOR01]